MANLPETPQWEEGIYQIEVSDPVLGGPDGISNRQGKQLASRTLYLKQQVEKGGSDLAKHIAAADPHTQYAPKASPTFTGTPTAPTPANSDNSKKLATTEFVAKALAALAGSAPETLDTLKELADALGNDPNFATTVLNKLAEKLAKDQNGADIPDPALFVKNLGLGELAKTPRFLVSKGSNANGWYEIYSDGFKRVGQAWSTPLSIPTPASGVRVNYPISFTSKLNGLFVTENGNTSNNFEFANPAQIGFTGFNMATMEVTLSSSPIASYGSSFTGFYVAEGY
ncbi:phage-related tail fiber protein-like protein [Enterobacter hormaechei]|uniref:phage tail protein n=2 Tax=Enterobacter TaxID=547 RepID=UPI00079A9F75|nr:phage tail protein [Enterobacter hormaechei]SAC56115.1 phage-related tail fiber protein-like protein [Enterobacter hormaechei]VAL35628.1 phage-related tail fiber protein-like protein [Enterobacter hormaechei]